MTDIVLYQDAHLIVVNKPATMPTQPDSTGDVSLLQQLETLAKEKLHVIHRLDRVASGLIVFAKSPQVASQLTQQFQQRQTEKYYWAIVEKKPSIDSNHLIHFLVKNAKTNLSKAFLEEKKGSKRAELAFILRGVSERYFLLDVTLFTGRHHQIRAQLSAIGCPIKGDVKYGARRSNVDRSIHLHAYQLIFTHPIKQEKMTFMCAPNTEDALWQFFITSSLLDTKNPELS